MENYIQEFKLNFNISKNELIIFDNFLEKYAWYPYKLFTGENNKYYISNLLDQLP